MSTARHPGAAPGGPIVVVGDGASDAHARACALRLGATLWTREAWEAADPAPVVVWCDVEGPGLRGPPRGAAVRRPPAPPVARPGRDPLVRALGLPPTRARVVDATAGWGVDAGVLAAAGAHVTMLERSPAMALLLEAAVERWRAGAHPAAARLGLREGDATMLLSSLPSCDVVYLDPLFPGRETRATSAVSLRWLRAVAAWSSTDGEDRDDERGLLEAARACATRRVVVKRARGDAFLAGVEPSGSLVGRTTRYDLYAGGGAAAT
jgi:16S rRNA (guanine1516-N2)-methyltransferase